MSSDQTLVILQGVSTPSSYTIKIDVRGGQKQHLAKLVRSCKGSFYAVSALRTVNLPLVCNYGFISFIIVSNNNATIFFKQRLPMFSIYSFKSVFKTVRICRVSRAEKTLKMERDRGAVSFPTFTAETPK